MAREGEHMVLHDYAMPGATGADSSFMRPILHAYNFEPKPPLVTFVERDQFSGHPSENPNMHLRNFLVKCDTINLNGVSTSAIWLRLFRISLRYKASDWLQNTVPNSFTTLEVLFKAFLSKYFPPEKLQSSGLMSLSSLNEMESPRMRPGRGLKTFSASAPITVCLIGF